MEWSFSTCIFVLPCKCNKVSEVIVVDFKEDLETIIERNLNREEHKHVPIEVVENIHERLKHEKIPSFAKVIEPADFEKETKWKLS